MSRMQKVAGLVGWLVVTGLAAFAGSVASRRSQEFSGTLIRPEWAPPPEVFGPVWTVLYLLMAVAAWLVWKRGGFARAGTALGLYLVQLRSEEHTSELQSRENLVCRLLLEKKKHDKSSHTTG